MCDTEFKRQPLLGPLISVRTRFTSLCY